MYFLFNSFLSSSKSSNTVTTKKKILTILKFFTTERTHFFSPFMVISASTMPMSILGTAMFV